MKLVQKQFLYAGIYAPLVFWATLALCGARFGEYSHLSRLVSELGAVGTPTRALFAAGLLVCSGLSMAFVVGVYRECRNAQISTAPALVILTFTVSIAGAGIYPMPHRLHGVLGSPSVLLFLSPMLAAILWRRASFLSFLRLFSVLSFAVMASGFLAFLPDVLEAWPGLKQRFFHAGWSIWFVYLSVGFSGFLKRAGKNQVGPRLGETGAGSA